MRSEHNGGASLAAFLLAVSTMMLLFVSPVEGQVGDDCVVTAFPGEPGSCPATDSQGDALLCVSGQCQTCESAGATTPGLDCSSLFAGEDQIANCLRDCFGLYVCTFNADCPASLPFCNIPEGECVATDPSECVVSAFPGETGSCPDPDQACVRTISTAPKTVCLSCASFETEFGITTAAECVILENPPSSQAADVVANCQRECFEFYACAFDTDCPADRPLCDAGQCVVSSVPSSPTSSPTFSPLDGIGGGSSA